MVRARLTSTTKDSSSSSRSRFSCRERPSRAMRSRDAYRFGCCTGVAGTFQSAVSSAAGARAVRSKYVLMAHAQHQAATPLPVPLGHGLDGAVSARMFGGVCCMRARVLSTDV